MTPTTAQVERVRQIVVETLAELGLSDVNWSLVSETLLLHDRACAGRGFGLEGVRAVWLCRQNTVKFFGPDGELLKTVDLTQPRRGGQNAA